MRGEVWRPSPIVRSLPLRDARHATFGGVWRPSPIIATRKTGKAKGFIALKGRPGSSPGQRPGDHGGFQEFHRALKGRSHA